MNHEYLIYTSNKSKLTYSESRAAFYLLSTLPYPLNTNPLHASVLNELSAEQRDKLYTAEQEVVLEQLQKINPEICIIQVPKSLYQFYLYSAIENIELSRIHKKILMPVLADLQDKARVLANEKLQSAVNSMRSVDLMFNEEIAELCLTDDNIENCLWQILGGVSEGNDIKSLFTSYHLCNVGFGKYEIWRAINDALVLELQRTGTSLSFSCKIHNFVGDWVDAFSRQKYTIEKRREINNDYHTFMHEEDNLQLLRKVLAFEVSCMFDPNMKDACILYRGSEYGIDSDLRLTRKQPNHGLSLGNGFCEGLKRDPNANAWCHMQVALPGDNNGIPNSGYAVWFDVKRYAQVFDVPPLSNLARTMGIGENFHVRTVSAYNLKYGYLLEKNSSKLTDMTRIRSSIETPRTNDLLFNWHLAKSVCNNENQNKAHDSSVSYRLS